MVLRRQRKEINMTMQFQSVAAMRLGSRTIVGLALVGALIALPTSATAGEIGGSERFGIGLVVGYPDVGLSINYFFTSSVSLQIDPTFYLGDHDDAIGGRVDLLFWMQKLAAWEVAELLWFWGPGANLGLGLGNHRRYAFGIEFPVGIGLRFYRAPIDVNLEAVPRLYLVEDTVLRIGGALNARYYF
ncbi:MAG: hypothetical protein A2289_03200 [Deltaproteobacteria bacterium RIFOXYA12_FULL_58_15]|nr:MAG: hypothetical protein A2289_03200 [Deltaproteobacteria bacterium RIFOXYA12_FULL_58_15]